MTRKHGVANRCWVDLYSGEGFGGRLVRAAGPAPIGKFSARSIICGPDATLMLTITRRGKSEVVQFGPSKVVEEIGSQLKGAKLVRAAIILTPTAVKMITGAKQNAGVRKQRPDLEESAQTEKESR